MFGSGDGCRKWTDFCAAGGPRALRGPRDPGLRPPPREHLPPLSWPSQSRPASRPPQWPIQACPLAFPTGFTVFERVNPWFHHVTRVVRLVLSRAARHPGPPAILDRPPVPGRPPAPGPPARPAARRPRAHPPSRAGPRPAHRTVRSHPRAPSSARASAPGNAGRFEAAYRWCFSFVAV